MTFEFTIAVLRGDVVSNRAVSAARRQHVSLVTRRAKPIHATRANRGNAITVG